MQSNVHSSYDYNDEEDAEEKKTKNPFISTTVALASLLILIGIVSVVLANFFVIQPKSQLAEDADICDVSTIAEYNDIRFSVTGATAIDLIRLGDDIESRSGYENDPDCTFMLTIRYIADNDYRSAASHLQQYMTLNNNGKFASGQIGDISSPSMLRFRVNSMLDSDENNGTSSFGGVSN